MPVLDKGGQGVWEGVWHGYDASRIDDLKPGVDGRGPECGKEGRRRHRPSVLQRRRLCGVVPRRVLAVKRVEGRR